jgi:hypothetical protein
MSFHMIARHGYAIERLKRDMAVEQSRKDLVDFLAHDAASFVFGFLLASGNLHRTDDRTVHHMLHKAIAEVLENFGINHDTFVVRPEIDAEAPLPEPYTMPRIRVRKAEEETPWWVVERTKVRSSKPGIVERVTGFVKTSGGLKHDSRPSVSR